ncbi:MAG: Helicase loader DnaI [Neobacillus sp.]|nr:Helicase loader DnaI [Neobacillus sp.]
MDRNRIKFANIPDAFKGMLLEIFNIDIYKLQKSRQVINLTLKVLNLYLDEIESHKATGKGLYIHSETKGSGKTRLVASIGNEMMRRYEIKVKFATSSNIIKEIKSTWDKENRTYTESALMDALATTPVLIIDDFGTEKIADWINDRFYNIINERYNNRLITMYTSNYPMDTLPYDERIKSRVKETTYIIGFPEESVRDYIAEHDNEEMLEKIMGDK